MRDRIEAVAAPRGRSKSGRVESAQAEDATAFFAG